MNEIYAKYNVLLETIKTGNAVQVRSLDKRTHYYSWNWYAFTGSLDGLWRLNDEFDT